jgi:iron complex outermembrane receptor protein
MRQGLYAEAVVPLQFSVSIEAAWRLDRIERDAASSPRIGTTWRPTDRLLVRGSMGRSFRSPSLLELNVVPADLYAGVTVSIPNTPGLPECGNPTVQGRCLVEIRTAANQNLQPERALFQGLGAVWQPANGLDMAIDYYRIVRKDEIALVTAQGLVSSPLEFPESWGMDETGRLQSLDVKHLNIAKSDIRGVYADATWRLRPAAWGALTVRVTGSHVLEADFSAHDGRAMDRVGHRAPATAGTTSLQWAQGAWAASAHLRHFSGYAIHDTAAPCPTGNVAARHCRNPSITTVAIGASYASPSGWRASAFVNNLTDHQPVDYDTARSGYNPSLDEPIGRSYLLRLDYPF